MPKHEVNITSKQYLLSCHYLVSISDQRCSLRGVGELVWRYVQVHLQQGCVCIIGPLGALGNMLLVGLLSATPGTGSNTVRAAGKMRCNSGAQWQANCSLCHASFWGVASALRPSLRMSPFAMPWTRENGIKALLQLLHAPKNV